MGGDREIIRDTTQRTVYGVLFAVSVAHLLNDMMQSVVPSIYPLIKDKFGFSFAQIGVITLVFQMTSSILQPFVGLYMDKRPKPYSLAIGMGFAIIGLLILAFANSFALIILAVCTMGCCSSIFHPCSTQVAQMVAGGQKGLAQSIFQIGGALGDRFGRKYVILASVVGAAPFALVLPYVNVTAAIVLAIVIGVVISSSHATILVYATELMPDKVGTIAGMFFGLSFGIAGLGAALFGWVADRTSIDLVFRICTLLPLIGIVAAFLPNVNKKKI